MKHDLKLYEQIRIKILELIREKNLQPHDPVPSEGELAKLFGVSRMTAKLALQSLANEGVVYRIARRGTFLAQPKHSQHAAVHNNRSNMLIGLVVPDLRDDYIGRVVTSIEQEASNQGFSLVIKLSGGDIGQEEKVLKHLVEDVGVEGIILFPGGSITCGDQVLRLKLSKFPIVIIDRLFREVVIDSVCHDHYQGAYQITKYLIQQGHEKIGYVSLPIENITAREDRYHGFLQAVMDEHIVVSRTAIKLDVKESEKHISTCLQDYLTQNPGLSAVVCMDDIRAAQLMYTALNMGIQVPDQLSITGFTGLTLTRFLPVPLTTVHQPTEAFGPEAIRLIQNRIDNPHKEVECVNLATRIIKRQSVKMVQAVS